MTTIRDVAAHAGLSVATVSRVLSGKGSVRPETRKAVLDAVAALDYRPNRIASNLRKKQVNIVGLIVSDIRNPFFTAIARAVEDVLSQEHLGVFLCNTDEDPEKEAHYFNTLLDERVAGIILTPTPSNHIHFKSILDDSVPLVFIDRRVEGVDADYVLSDNELSAQMLTNHVIQQGYTNIGAIIGLEASTTGRERMLGYIKSMEKHDLTPHATYIAPNEVEGEAVVRRWIDQGSLPEAIITGNSRITLGVLNALQSFRLRIPEDVALAGFDETLWAPHVGKGLTVISQPTYEMGWTAAELILQRLNNADRLTREVILKGHLIVRGSTSTRK